MSMQGHESVKILFKENVNVMRIMDYVMGVKRIGYTRDAYDFPETIDL